MKREGGLFYPDGKFKNSEDIKKDLAIKNDLPATKATKDLSYWLDKAHRRSADINQDTSVEDILLRFSLNPYTILCLVSDYHFGHPKTDYKRIDQELQAIKHTKRAKLITMGDLVDGIYWGGSSQSEQSATLEEQFKFVEKMFGEMGDKILLTTSGEHDSKWASKTGIDPYCFLKEGTPYVRGVAEAEITTGDQQYKLVFAHKLRGHSLYNNTHPQMRASRETQGADGYFSGHNHNKAIAEQPVREFGKSRRITFGALGAYKQSDEYAQRSGWVKQNPEQMYGIAIRMSPTEHLVEVDYDIIHALRRWA